jgi:GT2 family glycosyltransferase
MTDHKPGATVVVPTLNRGAFLLRTLQDLVAQGYRPLEIMVVDQSASTETSTAVEDFARRFPDLITYRRVHFRGLPQARNYGWQNARYEALIFVDDDIRCGPSLVQEHVRVLSRPGVGMVAGGVDEERSVPGPNANPGQFRFWTATPVRNFSPGGEHAAMHVAGCNFSIWRSVLKLAGGVDESLAAGAALYEETELCLRVVNCGLQIRFNGSARLLHLLAGQGGCRPRDIITYVASLAHNRAIVIGRYLKWFHMPTAYLRLLILITSYATHYRNVELFTAALRAMTLGRRVSKQPRVCADYQVGAEA